MNKSIILEAKQVSKFYADGQVKALDNVDLKVYAGEVLVLKGPSGCGKSTLMHLLGGLDRPTVGSILFNGVSLKDMCRVRGFRVKNIGFVFQAYYLWQHLNVLDNVLLPLVELPISRRERILKAKNIIETVGLSGKLKASVRDLSMGQRQRVAVARALVAEPAVLLADEPTGSLDSQNRQTVLKLFRQVNKERGVTVVMVTHEEMDKEFYDRKVRLLDGKTVNSEE